MIWHYPISFLRPDDPSRHLRTFRLSGQFPLTLDIVATIDLIGITTVGGWNPRGGAYLGCPISGKALATPPTFHRLNDRLFVANFQFHLPPGLVLAPPWPLRQGLSEFLNMLT